METTVKNTPLVSLFPRERDAITGRVITGHVMTEAEILAMDRRDAALRRARSAEYDEYRLGTAAKPTPAPGMNILQFRQRELPDMSNVIAFEARRKPDPTPPTTPAPAAPAVARAA